MWYQPYDFNQMISTWEGIAKNSHLQLSNTLIYFIFPVKFLYFDKSKDFYLKFSNINSKLESLTRSNKNGRFMISTR